MKINEILDDTREKFFDYLLDIAKKGGYYNSQKDREYVEMKATKGSFDYHQLDHHKTITWTFLFDDDGITEITKTNGNNRVVMFRRKGIAPNI